MRSMGINICFLYTFFTCVINLRWSSTQFKYKYIIEYISKLNQFNFYSIKSVASILRQMETFQITLFGLKSSSGSLPTRFSRIRCEVCIVQGNECVLYKYAMYFVQCVQIVLYRSYNVYHTGCAVCILHANLGRKKRTLISNLIYSNLIL